MKHMLIGSALVAAFALGCAAASSGLLPGAARAEAPASLDAGHDERGFVECFVATTDAHDGRAVNRGVIPPREHRNRAIRMRIPPGWTPIGGGGGSGNSAFDAYVVLCR